MNLQTVAENLRNTIAAKEQLLSNLKDRRIPPEVSIHYLEMNIAELRRILQDVEQCVPKEQTNPYHNADSGLYGPEYQGQ